MAYRFKRSEDVQQGLRRIAAEQIFKALVEIDDAGMPSDVVVHQVRKRCKKLRGLLRLVRPALGDTYDVENGALRDAAKRLSGLRDAKTIIGTYDKLMDHFADQVQRSAFGSVRRALTLRLQEISDQQMDAKIAAFRDDLAAIEQRVASWQISESGFDAIEGGWVKTLEHCHKRLKGVRKEATTEGLHDLRKAAKYHWYHVRLLRGVWPAIWDAYAEQIKLCAESLGDDHDLAVLSQKVSEDPAEFGQPLDIDALNGLIDQRRKKLQKAAIRQGRRLFAEPTDELTDRLESYWKQWRRKP